MALDTSFRFMQVVVVVGVMPMQIVQQEVYTSVGQ